MDNALPDGAGEPTPYDRYIRWAELAALWPRTGPVADWPGGIVVACGFQAAELSMRLVADARDDTREAADPNRRVHRLAEHLLAGQRAVLQALATLPAPPPELLSAAATAGTVRAESPGLKLLSLLSAVQVDEITTVFAVHAQRLPYRIGVEHHLAAARAAHGLTPLSAFDDPADPRARPVLDFERIVNPWTTWSLRETTPDGPEDHLFSTAHQISESWLAITACLLGRGREAAADGRWEDGARQLTGAAGFLDLVIGAGRLLDQMVLADYHPLRVALRDGSGAQSRTVHRLQPLIRQAGRQLLDGLRGRGLVLTDVLDRPGEHLGLHAYAGAVERAGKQLQNFLFQHYLLALGVLGRQTLGSLGEGVHTLAGHASRSLVPEIDQAHHDLAMLTAFRYGSRSGALVYAQEMAAGDPYPPLPAAVTCPPELVEERVRGYFERIAARDVDGWVALFDQEHGRVRDGVGTRPYSGERRLRVFLTAMLTAFPQLGGGFEALQIEGNRARATYTFRGVSYRGAATEFRVVDEFVLDADGRILEVTAHWDQATVADQWERALREPVPG